MIFEHEVHSPNVTLDLRKTKCPLNFVKAKLALEKLPLQSLLEVWINPAENSAINIPNSMRQEGHAILYERHEADKLCIGIVRQK
jgi:TusA-related sulfurtransferase